MINREYGGKGIADAFPDLPGGIAVSKRFDTMRRHIRRQCCELIDTISEAHGEIVKFIEKKDIQNAAGLLGDCQEAASTIGSIIEETEGEGTDAVSCLEAYCETVFRLHEEIISGENSNARNAEKRLQKAILKAQGSINALPTRYEAVFLPYIF